MAEIARAELTQRLEAKLRGEGPVRTALLADSWGVSELDLLRAWPGDAVVELDMTRVENLLKALPALGRVYTIVRNEGAVAEIPATYGGFSRSGPFLNVDSDGLHLHLKLAAFHAGVSFDSARPGAEPRPSLQFFAAGGASVLKVFLLPEINGPENFAATLQQWRHLVEEYRAAAAPAPRP